MQELGGVRVVGAVWKLVRVSRRLRRIEEYR